MSAGTIIWGICMGVAITTGYLWVCSYVGSRLSRYVPGVPVERDGGGR